jgi:cysteine desulfurase
LTGGSGNDTFNFNTNGTISGNVAGGAGNDSFNFNFANAVAGNADGGAGNDVFNINAITPVGGLMTGSDGNDAFNFNANSSVRIMLANNEIGTLQPLKQIAEICHEAGVPLHTDAVQATGKIRTHVDELEVDLLSLAGHKMYAPKGVGALYVRQGVALEPVLHGAGHESGLRAGTENVAGIVAFGAAAVLATKSLDASQERLAALRDDLHTSLRAGIGAGMIVHGELAPRLPNTLSVSFPGVSAYELLARVPELCTSTGSASHGETDAMSPTLAAMGVAADVARGTIRLSLGWYTTEEEIERASSLLLGAWEAVKG